MAKGGDKRRIEENRRHLGNLKLLLAVANGAYLIIRILIGRSSVTSLHYIGLMMTTICYGLSYLGIAAALAPHYSPSGELIYSGADLKTGGVIEYYHDVMYVAAFVQLLGCYTDKAWYVFGVIPLYALFALVTKVLLPSWTAPEVPDIPENELDRKRREKKERQAARAEKFRR